MTLVLLSNIALIILAPEPLVVVLGWVLPVTVLYQQSALLRLVVEHHWDQYPNLRGKRADILPLTKAIFLGSVPPKNPNLIEWGSWILDMLLALIVRLTILPGDSGAAHDWHHQCPRGNWANYIAERRKEARNHPDNYDEIWGYHQALVKSLNSISKSRG